MPYNQRSEPEVRMAKRRRKSLHLNEPGTKNISGFIAILDSRSIILPEKRPNTTIKDLEINIKQIYDMPVPDCFIMDGEEYKGERNLHDLTREKYLYVPFQSVVDVEVKFFTMTGAEPYVESLRKLDKTQLESLDSKVIEKIKYGVQVINFHKKKAPISQNTTNLQAFIPQILRGNTCDDSNESKIDYLMRQKYKSPPMNIRQSILNFKQNVENELRISLDNVDVFDLYRFCKLPDQQTLSTFLTRTDYTDYILVFRFKQVPKENKICIVINQVIPVQISPPPELNPVNAANAAAASLSPPKQIQLQALTVESGVAQSVLDLTRKEQWAMVDAFCLGCKVENPRDWTAHEVQLWLNYVKTTMSIEPVSESIRSSIIYGNRFYPTIHNVDFIHTSFRYRSKSDASLRGEIDMMRFVRHCDLLLKYKVFYQFKGVVSSQPPAQLVATGAANETGSTTSTGGSASASKQRGPLGRSKARREVLVSQLGGRREIQLLPGNCASLMETRLGQSLYSGRNSVQATIVSQHQHRKWTFLLSCLTTPGLAHQLTWLDYDGGFRLVEQDAIARLYGKTCSKPDMTYDKLSRGLRYDRSGLIEKADKNYCWKLNLSTELVLGLSVERIVQKMYTYYQKRNQAYPADLLLKENLNKLADAERAETFGEMKEYTRSKSDADWDSRCTLPEEAAWTETVSCAGYMSTDRRINFWANPNLGASLDNSGTGVSSLERYHRRLAQGRTVHCVMPNEPEFVALTSLNGGAVNGYYSNSRQMFTQYPLLMPPYEPGCGDDTGRVELTTRGDPLLGEGRIRCDSMAISEPGTTLIGGGAVGGQTQLGGASGGHCTVEEELVLDDGYWAVYHDDGNSLD